MRIRHLSALVVVVVASVLVAVAAPASAAPTKKGQTVVTLDSGFAAALTSLGVQVGAVNPAYGKGSGVAFPIVGNPARGVIKHVGGLTLAAGDTTVSLTNYWIDGAVITGVVNGSDRLPLFDITTPGGVVTLDLTDVAAGALNAAFGISALSGSTKIATAVVESP